MRNADMLDRFKARHGIDSDYALAKLLNVSMQVVSNFRRRNTDTLVTKMLEYDLDSDRPIRTPTTAKKG